MQLVKHSDIAKGGKKMGLKIVVTLIIFGMIMASALVSGQHPLKTDTDGDGMSDGWEVEHGLNPQDANDANFDYNHDGLTNFQGYRIYRDDYEPWGKDTDGDGISNYAESTGLFGFFTDPVVEDTDGDGLSDLIETCAYIDTGNRTQMKEIYTNETDRESARNSTISLCRDYPYKIDPTNSDVDGDGLNDGDEIFRDNKTNPNCIDSDYDGLSDGDEVHKYKTEPADRDTDRDGLLDSEEVFGTHGVVTDPTKSDTDGDGISDGEEIFGFGFVPIEPSRHALTYEEFISGAYGGEYITLKARVDKIRHSGGLSNYSISLKPLEPGNGAEVESGVARVNSSWHYDFDLGEMMHVDDRFELALCEGDTIVIVGKAGKLGSTREIEVDSGGKMYLVLTPEEARERWLPSKDYVKIISKKHGVPTVMPSLLPSPSPGPSPTPTSTSVQNSSLALNTTPTPTPSPSPVNATINSTNELTSESGLKKEGEGISGLFIHVVIGFVITSLFLYAKFGRKKLKEKKREEEAESLWVVSDIQKKREHTYEVAVNKEGKGATIELNERLYKRLIRKKRLTFGTHRIFIRPK